MKRTYGVLALLIVLATGCIQQPGTPTPALDGHIVGNGGDPNETLFDQARVQTTRVLRRFSSEDTQKILRSVGERYREADVEELKRLADSLHDRVLKSIHHWDEKLPAGCPTNTCGCTLTDQPGHIFFSHVNCRSYQLIRQASRNLLHEAFHSENINSCERARHLTALAYDLWVLRGATEDPAFVSIASPTEAAHVQAFATMNEEIVFLTTEALHTFRPATATWLSTKHQNNLKDLSRQSHEIIFPFRVGRHLIASPSCYQKRAGVLYDLDLRTFSALPPKDPTKQLALSIVQLALGEDRFFNWGRYECDRPRSDGESFHTDEGEIFFPKESRWESIAQGGPKEASWKTKAIWTGEEVIVWGGTKEVGGAAYNPTTRKWRALSNTNQPTPRMNHLMLWTGKEVVVYGGVCWDESDEHYDGEDCTHRPVKTGATYNPKTDSWVKFESPNGPAPRDTRSGFSPTFMGNEFVVVDNEGFLHAFNSERREWRLLPLPQAPSQTLVWTGGEFVVPDRNEVFVLYP